MVSPMEVAVDTLALAAVLADALNLAAVAVFPVSAEVPTLEAAAFLVSVAVPTAVWVAVVPAVFYYNCHMMGRFGILPSQLILI